MLAILLIVLGIGSRLVTPAPQFTAILAVALFGGMYLKPRQALLLPVTLMMVTDLILGFHDTMFYTWGSMVAISAIGLWLKEQRTFVNVLGGSVLSAILFFVVTNFGAWTSILYPHTWAGLRECYIMAVPFFRATLVSTVVYSLALYAVYEWALKRCHSTSLARLF